MSEAPKVKTLLVRNPARKDLPLEKLALVLQKIASHGNLEKTTAPDSNTLKKEIASQQDVACVFIDIACIEEWALPFDESWRRWHVVLVRTGGGKQAATSERTRAWKENFSTLNLERIQNTELLKILQMAIAHEKGAGIASLMEKNNEVYFEKVHKLSEMGSKLDRFFALLEEKYPQLSSQYFNLRQLCFSVLHLS